VPDTPSVSRARTLAAKLNERQRAYLLAVYDEDQRREAVNQGIGAPPAKEWRWIEYGPDISKFYDTPLRNELKRAELVDRGSGATWAVLEKHALVETMRMDTGFRTIGYGRRRVLSMFVRMTRNGRVVARAIRGEPPTRPRAPRSLSLLALRLLDHGQRHPNDTFGWSDVWPGRAPDYLMILTVARSLIKRGLLAGYVDDAANGLRITPAGLALNIVAEPNWAPLSSNAVQ
jgi:hypothetical protein